MPQKLTQEIQDALDSLAELRNELSYEEWKMRFAEHKERFKLMGLYNKVKQLEAAVESEAEQHESEEMEAVRNHLESLDLAPAGTPLGELARLAVLKIIEKE